MTDTQLETLFRQFWSGSYLTPPGTHALMTHTAWARFLLTHIGHQQQTPEQPR